MIILDATTKKLQIVLAGAITTSELDVVSTYVDVTTTAGVPSAFVSGESDTTSNSTTPVDIVAAPAANTQRQVKLISVENTDTNPATATIRYNNNGTVRKLVTITLAVGSTLQYTDGEGWRVIDTDGGILQTTADAGVVLSRTVVLTNAQILALPTTPVTLVPAPGSGFMNVFIQASLRASIVGVYTNVDPDECYLAIDDNSVDLSNYLANVTATTPTTTYFTDVFENTGSRSFYLVPQTLNLDPASDLWGNIAKVNQDGANKIMQIQASNNGAGVFTGGDAGNTLTVTVYYAVQAV